MPITAPSRLGSPRANCGAPRWRVGLRELPPVGPSIGGGVVRRSPMRAAEQKAMRVSAQELYHFRRAYVGKIEPPGGAYMEA